MRLRSNWLSCKSIREVPITRGSLGALLDRPRGVGTAVGMQALGATSASLSELAFLTLEAGASKVSAEAPVHKAMEGLTCCTGASASKPSDMLALHTDSPPGLTCLSMHSATRSLLPCLRELDPKLEEEELLRTHHLLRPLPRHVAPVILGLTGCR